MGAGRWTAGAVAGSALGLVLLAGATACSSSVPSSSSGTTAEGASCAAILRYAGREYRGAGTAYRVPVGRALGTATEPGCADVVVDGKPRGSSDHPVEVSAVRGVDPRWAIAYGNDFGVYVARDASKDRMPAALRRVLRRPACTGSGPVTLAGKWIDVELDRARSAIRSVELIVDRASPGAQRYLQADLRVRVTARTEGNRVPGEPVLDDRSRVEVVAHCAGTAFEADRVTPGEG
ncbi:MAG: DUF6281 family protein [Frankiaceae bacterium]